MARKKQGRNKDWCKSYRASGTRERNRAARLRREVRKQPTNFQAISALEGIDAKAGKAARKIGEDILHERKRLALESGNKASSPSGGA
jgi:hypothetical protein